MNEKLPEGWRVVDGGAELRESLKESVRILRRKIPLDWNTLAREDLVASHQKFMREQDIHDLLAYLKRPDALEAAPFVEALMREVEARLLVRGDLGPRA